MADLLDQLRQVDILQMRGRADHAERIQPVGVVDGQIDVVDDLQVLLDLLQALLHLLGHALGHDLLYLLLDLLDVDLLLVGVADRLHALLLDDGVGLVQLVLDIVDRFKKLDYERLLALAVAGGDLDIECFVLELVPVRV